MGQGVPHKLIDIQLQGAQQIKDNLQDFAQTMPVATAAAFLEEMKDTMKESQAECPYDYANLHLDGTPHLRDTAQSEIGIQNDNEIEVLGSYGTPYAVYVHEILENHHLYPTKAKFLEDPATRRAPFILGHVSEKLRLLFRGDL